MISSFANARVEALAAWQNVDAMTIRSSPWVRDPRWQSAFILSTIVVLALIPWFVAFKHVEARNILHHLNFLPLMMAGMVFGIRGALLATCFAALANAPHVAHHWKAWPIDASDQVIELSIFGAAGLIAGFLSDRERRQRFSLERTKQELENVYYELQQNLERLRKAERLYAAGQLSASLAHEIRNPLASIAGAAGILKRGNASTQNFRDCLEIIEKESQRLNKLLTGFLDFARPRAPRFQLTDLSMLITSVAVLARHAAGASNIELLQEVNGELPEVECDPEQLKQVLLNLVINAAQASPPGGGVWLSASAAPDRVRISVRDEGCGIPLEKQDKIFDPFFTTKENGTGLGLAIASMIVEQHQGLLTAKKNSGQGMTFCLELPRDRTQPI